MPARQVNSFHHREFQVVVAQNDDGSFVAIGRDKDRKELARLTADSQDAVTNEIKTALNAKSNDFVDINGAINLFRKPFPEDFADPFFRHHEGDYKENARLFIIEHLDKDVLETLLSTKSFEQISVNALRCVQKTNLPSPFEKTKLNGFVSKEKNHEPFSNALYDLLYGNDFDNSLKSMAKLLAPDDAAKWPIITYWPFFCLPDQHMYMKPEIVQNTAYRLGFELSYESYPNPQSYKSLLELTDFIRDGISEMKPSSNIDIQSFMYVVAKDNYVAEAIECRKIWEGN